MAEIQLNKTIAFDDGFVIEASQNLVYGITYSLKIDDGTNIINKIYTPSINKNVIIDSWGSIIPLDVSVCFALSDTVECPPISCNLTIT